MREIKFRAKDLFGEEFQKKWRFGYLVKDGVKGNFSIREMSGNDFPPRWTERSCAPETIGQYTGLKDKNGKEIYEGDILSGFPHGSVQVAWCEEYACFESVSIDDAEQENCLFANDLKDCFDEWQVVGNIHENPELLVTEKDLWAASHQKDLNLR